MVVVFEYLDAEVGSGFADEAEGGADVDLVDYVPCFVGHCVQHFIEGEASCIRFMG